MNWDHLEGSWKTFGGKLKERWGRLAGNRQCELAGTRDQAAGRIQERYGRSKEKVARQFREFLHRNRDWNLPNR